MKLKINNSEMLSMVDALNIVIREFNDRLSKLDMDEKLWKACAEEMYMKLAPRAIKVQDSYQIELKPSWAISFHLIFNQQLDRKTYAGNLIQGLCDQIHQHYS